MATRWPQLIRPLILLVTIFTSNQAADQPIVNSSACAFPVNWYGEWYRNDQPLFSINSTHFGRGRCVQRWRNKYLLITETEKHQCWTCVIVFQKHHNVVQLKETLCGARGRLEDVCDRFLGDSLLITIFRANGQPSDCPIVGPFNFTYSSYRTRCTSRMSIGEPCADNSKLRLLFQACPESQASESKVEDVQCYGWWSSDRKKFFAGRLLGKSSSGELDNFRCFIYESQSHGGTIGISADSSCIELTDMDSAVTQIKFSTTTNLSPECQTNKWLSIGQNYPMENRVWTSLSKGHQYRFSEHEMIVSDSEDNVTVGTCVEKENSGQVTKFVFYTIHNCDRGYQCVKVYKRSAHIVDVSVGFLAPTPHHACTAEYFHESALQLETLIDTQSSPEKCPHQGNYLVSGCQKEESEVSIGCDEEQAMIVALDCDAFLSKAYECVGHWEHGEWHYLILRELTSKQLGCAIYSQSNRAIVNMSKINNSCPRTVSSEPIDLFNFRLSGYCSGAKSSPNHKISAIGAVVMLLVSLLLTSNVSLGQ